MPDAAPDADVVIVGGGPAGLATATELRRNRIGRVIVLEREAQAGGVPRHCGHSPFGMREFGRPMTGPAYARALVARAIRAGVEIRTGTTATAILDGPSIETSSDAGKSRLTARFVLVATGIRESTRAARLIGGTKPAGVMTTGALQGLVHGAGMRPFRRPVILGTELVAFSAILTCRHAGIRPVAMIDSGDRVTARFPAAMLPKMLGIPLHLSTDLVAIEGIEHTEAVIVRQNGKEHRIATDGVIVTGRFRPEAALLRQAGIRIDPRTGGPEIDEFGRTSHPVVFAAGNILRPVETAGWCWEEGRRVARAITAAMRGEIAHRHGVPVTISGALGYAVPQRIAGGGTPAHNRFQLRAAEAVRGRLSVTADGHEIAGRSARMLPERRLLLPLPPANGAPGVALVADP